MTSHEDDPPITLPSAAAHRSIGDAHMHRIVRSSLLLLAALAVGACSADVPVTPRMSPARPAPTWAKVKASDSMMVMTEEAYPDTATALMRTSALASDVSVTATIGSSGGELSIPSAGITMKIPGGALSASTSITMTALAGSVVAYSFQPHGLVFAKPVKLEQSLAATEASTTPLLLTNAHAAYFDTSLEGSFVDAGKTRVKVKENMLTYHEKSGGSSKLKFSIGHFSGYLVACGVHDERSRSW
ncbi:MAG: hypothetical protein JWL60_2239 [Gemmatimonadetes bacterium]|jgi:hypothetical protein|nr:hypothetical protein [Gemmatimonadota bacterium]